MCSKIQNREHSGRRKTNYERTCERKGRTYGPVDANGQSNRRIDQFTDGRTGQWMDGAMNEWTTGIDHWSTNDRNDGLADPPTYKQILVLNVLNLFF